MNRTAFADMEELLINSFEAFEKSLNGQSQSSLHQTRRDAIRAFERQGFPDNKSEEYKYTHIAKAIAQKFDFSSFHATSSPTLSAKDDLLPFRAEDVYAIVSVNGRWQEHLQNNAWPRGVNVRPLNAVLESDPQFIKSHFAQYANYNNDPYVALNTAFTRDGLVVEIDDNTVLDKPVVIYQILASEKEQALAQPRNLFVIGQNAEASILEVNLQQGDLNAFSNIVTEVSVKKHARFSLYKLQQSSASAYQIDNTQIFQERESVVNTFTCTLSGAIVRNNLSIAMLGERCESFMYGLYLTQGKSHVDNHTVVDHIKPNCYSNEIYKGIMDDHSRGVFNGKIYVRQAAQKTNAFQSNKNIVLTDTAGINSKPQLEIWADDVKCSHGCTTGQLDEEQMFYLRSRGIAANKARALLLHAFAADVLEGVKIDFLKEYLDEIIHSRLD
jgi:Fe-S cluster assembly protein SufD